MIASFWPLAAVLVTRRLEQCRQFAATSVIGFSAMIAGSFTALSSQYNPGHLELPASFLLPRSRTCQAMTDRALEQLSRSKAVLVAGSVLALAPDSYTYGETVLEAGASYPNTVIYFANGYGPAAARR